MVVIAGIKPRMWVAACVAIRKGFHFGRCPLGRRVLVMFYCCCDFICCYRAKLIPGRKLLAGALLPKDERTVAPEQTAVTIGFVPERWFEALVIGTSTCASR